MPLLNYTTKIEAVKTAAEIVTILAKHRAVNIMMDYDGAAKVTGIKWRVETEQGPLGFQLPVNVDAVFGVMSKQRILNNNSHLRRLQSERTAWRILKDWIEAQMALLETDMVKMEEIFLPYMLSGDKTFYQVMLADGFRAAALPAGIE